MENQKEMSFITAERLKRLRERDGLSHEKLKSALMEKYGITISSDSLMSYEATPDSSKKYKNNGMRIEYLRCLSDFYGVSADYLLGITDIQHRDIAAQGIVEKTGLSPFAVEWLINTKQDVSYYDLPPLKLNDARHAFVCYLLEASIECTSDSEIIQAFRHAYRALTNDSYTSYNEESKNEFVSVFKKMEQFGWYSITGEDAGKWFAHRIAEKVEGAFVDVIERFGYRWKYGEHKAEG